MIFQLPSSLADSSRRQELERSSVTGGQDNMPYPTQTSIEAERLILTRTVDESGNLQVPWQIEGVGRLMSSTATLMERAAPYQLPIELARGKINQLRAQAAEWAQGGLIVPDALADQIKAATLAFGQALTQCQDGESTHADRALQLAHQAALQLAGSYVRRVFELRHERQPKFDSWLGCRLEPGDSPSPFTSSFLRAFNAVTIPFSWKLIEPRSGEFCWDSHDRILDEAMAHDLKVIGGPLIDFTGRNLPDWLWEHTYNLHTLSFRLTEHVESLVRRYASRIRTWQITAGSNCAGILARRDEELIWLTLRLAEAVRRVNPHFEVIVGIAQPWGDYLAEQERSKTPFIFADDLLRTGVKLAALELEFIFGVAPRGSYCRDLLDTSRLLDLYALLGVPIQTLLAYPSSAEPCEHADPDQRVELGHWSSGYSPETQADWVRSFAALALCKPYARSLQWPHWSDTQEHAFPHCGVVDLQGREKPALEELGKLRSAHLR